METLSKQFDIFRAAYLRSIAKSWVDNKYKKEIVSFKGAAKNVLVLKPFTDLLQEPIEKKWRMDIAIVNNNSVSYNPYSRTSDNGWNGDADVLVIKIPKKPTNNKSHVSALAKYYELFPTPFGNNLSGVDKEELKDVSDIQDLFVPFEYSEKAILKARRENLSNETGDGGVKAFDTFGIVMMDIVAKCWENNAFLQALTDNPIKPIGQKGSEIKDVFRNFANEWAFSIVFEEDDNATWNEATQDWDNLSNNQIYLQYPAKPDADFSETRALSRYNATGPVFPLSCM